MARSKTFRHPGSQAVCISGGLERPPGEVEVRRQGSGLLITPVQTQSAAVLFDLLTKTEGLSERPETQAQERDAL